MAGADGITEEGRKAIVDVLNKAIQIEYGMILNYPRILDQIKNIDKSQSEEFTVNLERLGKDSFRHATVISRLIEDLGGKPAFDMVVVDVMADVHSMLVEQLGKEKLAAAAYKEARFIAENNQAKEPKIFGKFLGKGRDSEKGVRGSVLIDTLKRIEMDEVSHIKRVENLLIQMNINPEDK